MNPIHIETKTVDISVKDGSISGYLAAVEDRGPGVLVLHSWWGLNDFVKQYCNRLAGEGFTALAPDFYHGKVTDDVEQAKKLRDSVDKEALRRELTGSADYLRLIVPEVKNKKIGMIGFSIGAYWGLWLADQRPDEIKAVVIYYGQRNVDKIKSKAAFLGHFAYRDPYVQEDALQKMKQGLEQAGVDVSFYIYPDTTHWFAEEDDHMGTYQPDAAHQAWERTLDFLKKHIK